MNYPCVKWNQIPFQIHQRSYLYTGIVSLVIAISYAINPKYLENMGLQNDGDIVAS